MSITISADLLWMRLLMQELRLQLIPSELQEKSSLKAAAPVQSSDSADGSTEGSTDGSTDGTQSAGTDSASSGDGSSDGTITNSGGFTQEQLTDTNQTRTIYRNSDGHPPL